MKTFVAIVGLAACAMTVNARSDERGYFHATKDERGAVTRLLFFGSADWLSQQSDPASHFHEFPNLRALAITEHTITPAEMDYVVSLRNVTSLDIGYFPDAEKLDGAIASKLGNMTCSADKVEFAR